MEFVVLGPPVGKGRPRVVSRGGFARAYTPKGTADWEQVCAMLARQQHNGPPLETPQRLQVLAIKDRPKRLLRKRDPDGLMWRVSKPDGDNVLKAVGDALVKAGVIRDDTTIVVWECRCLYAERDGAPRVEVLLDEVEGEP